MRFASRQPLDPNVPVMIVMRLLGRKGWRRGVVPDAHTADSAKHFGHVNFHAKRPYLQCLLVLDQLGQRGLSELSPKQPMAYYRLVLHSKAPGSVPLGKLAKDYTSELGSSIAQGAVRIVHSDWVAPASDDEEDALMRAEFAEHADCGDGHDMAVGEQSGDAHEPGDLLSKKPHSSSDNPSIGQPNELYPVNELGDPIVSSFLARSVPYIPLMPNIRFEQHLEPGQPNHYKRLIVNCPLANCEHRRVGAACGKKRNMGQRQTAKFGEREPEGYLGAWAAAADRFTSSEAHVRWNPSTAQVRKFMVSRGWSVVE